MICGKKQVHAVCGNLCGQRGIWRRNLKLGFPPSATVQTASEVSIWSSRISGLSSQMWRGTNSAIPGHRIFVLPSAAAPAVEADRRPAPASSGQPPNAHAPSAFEPRRSPPWRPRRSPKAVAPPGGPRLRATPDLGEAPPAPCIFILLVYPPKSRRKTAAGKNFGS